MIHVRPAIALDAASMARLLNAIIEKGGTTALTRPVAGKDMIEWMDTEPTRSAWHVALDDAEEVVGFQWIAPNGTLPDGAVDIATFVQIGRTGLGIGSALFNATAKDVKTLGYGWIYATIRADNEGGLTYYQSRGFRDWSFEEAVVLDSGQVVDKVKKRYDV